MIISVSVVFIVDDESVKTGLKFIIKE